MSLLEPELASRKRDCFEFVKAANSSLDFFGCEVGLVELIFVCLATRLHTGYYEFVVSSLLITVDEGWLAIGLGIVILNLLSCRL